MLRTAWHRVSAHSGNLLLLLLSLLLLIIAVISTLKRALGAKTGSTDYSWLVGVEKLTWSTGSFAKDLVGEYQSATGKSVLGTGNSKGKAWRRRQHGTCEKVEEPRETGVQITKGDRGEELSWRVLKAEGSWDLLCWHWEVGEGLNMPWLVPILHFLVPSRENLSPGFLILQIQEDPRSS